MSEFLKRVPCPLCASGRYDELHRIQKRTGTFLGRIEVVVSQCLSCGFVFNSPRPTAAAMDRYYAEEALASGRTFRADGAGAYYPALFVERAEFYAPLLISGERPATKLLDVGCGSGGFLSALDASGVGDCRLFGLEPSLAGEVVQRFEVTRGYLGDRVFDDDSFDAISLISVLEHLADPLGAMREVARMLRPGGIVLLEVPNTLHLELSLTGCFGLEHICHFTPGSLARLLAQVGLGEMRLDDRVRDHGLRLVAGADLAQWNVSDVESFADDRAEVAATICRYRARERRYFDELGERVGRALERWTSEGTRIALYGAGAHTVELNAHFDLKSYVEFIVDGDTAKQGTELLGMAVLAPEAILEHGIGAVLLSSHRFIEEMEANVRAVAGESVEIGRCYGAADFEFVR